MMIKTKFLYASMHSFVKRYSYKFFFIKKCYSYNEYLLIKKIVPHFHPKKNQLWNFFKSIIIFFLFGKKMRHNGHEIL